MGGHERLVGGDHGLAGVECGEHELAGKIDAADDLNDQIDVVAGDQPGGIVSKQILRHPGARFVAHVRDGDAAHLGRPANAVGESVSVFLQQAEDLGADCSETQQGDAHGFAFAFTSTDGSLSNGRIKHVTQCTDLAVYFQPFAGF